ncbi:hypothetical protein A3K74_03515 [Candidatus Pacearchaeota archaeon RBG_13_33_26]|nr:MAG: hypothetical protein A3K74_03515 [Candidatus Pacearchaeota archaeon RBG_13_33_26]
MKISEQKKEKIYEQILALLYSVFPKALFTLNIAEEIARDEEFVKSLLLNLKKKDLIIDIKKNPKGCLYLKRTRWKLSDSTYEAYKKRQNIQNP